MTRRQMQNDQKYCSTRQGGAPRSGGSASRLRAGRRGFYFSFDALLALTMLSLSLLFLLHASSPVQNSVSATVNTYRQTNTYAEDAAQLATQNTLREAFPSGFVDTYINDTVLEAEDADKSVLDVITILWASNETATAANISQEYFGEVIPADHGFRFSVIDDQRYVVYNTSSTGTIENLANAKRVVSGVQKNRPQQGFLARARAEKVRKNMSRVLPFSPMGGANSGGKMHIWKRFNLSDVGDVVNTTLYIAVHYGCANNQFENLKVNGNNIKNEIAWIHQREDNCPDGTGTGAYGVVNDVSQYLQNGTNTVYMRFRNNQYQAHTHPGMKLEMTLTDQKKNELQTSIDRRIHFDEVKTTEQGNDNSGAFAVKPFAIPENATQMNATVHLEATDIDRVYSDAEAFCGSGGTNISDVMVFFNGEKVYSDYAPTDGTFSRTFNLTNRTTEGTNVVSAYFNTFGDCFWGSDETRIEANLSGGSYIDVSYERPRSSLVFGKIELTRNEHLGGGLENPKIYNKSFTGRSIISTDLHVAQLFSDQVLVNVTDANGQETQVFRSTGIRSVPSSIFIDQAFYTATGNNTVYMEDETVGNDFVPESSFEYTMLVPSQVGYGGTFQNRSAAMEDAKERLNATLGPFVESTEIDSNSLSVNDVPWLFGPVTVDLEVWRSE